MPPKRSLFEPSLKERYVKRCVRNEASLSNSSAYSNKDGNNVNKEGEETQDPTSIATLKDAISAAEDCINNKSTLYTLVDWKKYCSKWKDRAEVYCHFEILCHKNTLQSTGWATCKYVKEGLCSCSDGTKKFRSALGNGAFHRHVELHEKHDKRNERTLIVPSDRKRIIIEAVAKSCASDSIPLSFCERWKGFNE